MVERLEVEQGKDGVFAARNEGYHLKRVRGCHLAWRNIDVWADGCKETWRRLGVLVRSRLGLEALKNEDGGSCGKREGMIESSRKTDERA